MLGRDRLLQLTEAFRGKRVMVYADIVADRFIYGNPKRISREAPVLILRQYREDTLLGGGGNAINNIASLGGVPVPVAILGDDREAEELLRQLAQRSIDCGGISRISRYRTPTKVRVLGGMPHSSRQQIVRYDIEDHIALSAAETASLATAMQGVFASCAGALVSDYGYGVVTPALMATFAEAREDKPVTLDSRYQLLDFSAITAATPNEEEAAAAAGMELFGDAEEEKVARVGETLRQRLAAEAVLITRGSRGMALFQREREPLFIPVHGSDQIADVTGAGDTVIATFTLALVAGASFVEAAYLANYAGAIVVMKMGTATATNDELRNVIERDEQLER